MSPKRTLLLLLFACALLPGTAAAQSPEAGRKALRSKQISEAKRFVHMGRPEMAIERLKGLLADSPDDVAALDALGWVYLELGRVGEAEKTYRRLLEVDPKNRSAHRSLGKMRYDAGKVDEAVALWEALVDLEPKNPGTYRFVGGIEMTFELFGEAEALFRRGRKACGSPTLFAAELGRLALLQGKTDLAVGEFLLQLRENPASYVVVRQQVLRLAEDSGEDGAIEATLREHLGDEEVAPEIWGILAHLRLDADDFAGARAAMEERRLVRDLSSREQIDFARACLEKRDAWGRPVGAAREIAEDLLVSLFESGRKDHHVPSAGLLLAGLYLDRMDRPGHPLAPEEAEALAGKTEDVLNRIIDRYTGSFFGIQANLLKGRLLFRHLGEPAAAYDFYMAFVDQSPQGPETSSALVEAGNCLLAMGDYKTARAHFQGLSFSPSETDQGTARYYLALVDLLEGKTDEAFEGFTEFAETYPHLDQANDALEMAWILQLARQGEKEMLPILIELERALLSRRFGEAREVLSRIVSGFEGSVLRPRALYMKGELEFESGDFDAALASFRDLLEEYPDHRLAPRALEGMGRVYLEGRNEAGKALFEYEMILTRYPDFLFLDEVRERVRTLQAYVVREAPEQP